MALYNVLPSLRKTGLLTDAIESVLHTGFANISIYLHLAKVFIYFLSSAAAERVK